MTISKRIFGALADGTPVHSWTLINENGLQAEILDYGVTIRSILVPDKAGNAVDVVLGYDTLDEYLADDCYFGATVGRFANRIKDAQFQLNGVTYQLYANNGANHLHGGKRGFNRYVWDSRQVGDRIVFSRVSPHGEEGYPGNLSVRVTIGWKDNSLAIEYEAEADRDTIVNLTNHSYFNLNGAGNGNINQHLLQVNAEHYTLNGPDCTPTGEIVPVDGSAMDFRKPKTIGQDAGKDEPCVKFFNGYDSNFVLSGSPAAAAVGDITGIKLIVNTDQPGVQLYTGNVLAGQKGKDGKSYHFRGGFCLETQHFPDCIHHPDWPTCVLRAGEGFRSFTTYTFI